MQGVKIKSIKWSKRFGQRCQKKAFLWALFLEWCTVMTLHKEKYKTNVLGVLSFSFIIINNNQIVANVTPVSSIKSWKYNILPIGTRAADHIKNVSHFRHRNPPLHRFISTMGKLILVRPRRYIETVPRFLFPHQTKIRVTNLIKIVRRSGTLTPDRKERTLHICQNRENITLTS